MEWRCIEEFAWTVNRCIEAGRSRNTILHALVPLTLALQDAGGKPAPAVPGGEERHEAPRARAQQPAGLAAGLAVPEDFKKNENVARGLLGDKVGLPFSSCILH